MSTSRSTSRTHGELSQLVVRAVVVALVAALALIAVTALLPEPHTRPVLEPASAPVESIEPVTVSDGSDVTVTSLG